MVSLPELDEHDTTKKRRNSSAKREMRRRATEIIIHENHHYLQTRYKFGKAIGINGTIRSIEEGSKRIRHRAYLITDNEIAQKRLLAIANFLDENKEDQTHLIYQDHKYLYWKQCFQSLNKIIDISTK